MEVKRMLCYGICVLISYLSLASTQDPTKSPVYIKVNTTCHELTFLFDLYGHFRSKVVIKDTGLLRSDNVLYYSFEPIFEDREYYKVGFVNLSNPQPAALASEHLVFNFGTFDIDQENKVIYLGGSDGIYQLDLTNNKLPQLQPFSSRGDTVVSLVYKGDVYFTRYDENKIIRKKGDKFITFLESNGTIKNFVLAGDVTVFLTNFGLFAEKSGQVVRLSKNAFFRGITTDLDGVIYAWWLDNMYKVVIAEDFTKSTVVKVARISTLGSMTFDNGNNILITLENSLFRLTPTNFTHC